MSKNHSFDCLKIRYSGSASPQSGDSVLRAVAFDFDGLLADTEATWRLAESRLLAKYGIVPTPQSLSVFLGLSLEQAGGVLEDLLNMPGTGDSLTAELIALAREEVAGSRLMSGAHALVESLLGHVSMAIVSNGDTSLIDDILCREGLDGCFDAVITASELCHPKPEPCPYLFAADTLGISPPELIVLEDSPIGALAGILAGSYVVGVNHAGSVENAHICFASLASPRLITWLHENLRQA